MELVILSYRESYSSSNCTRGCCGYTDHDSNLNLTVVSSEEEAANFIAHILDEDRDAPYIHLVFDSWRTFVDSADSFGYCNTYNGVESIVYSHLDEDEFFDYDQYLKAVEKRDVIIDRIKELTSQKLHDLKIKRDNKEQQKLIDEKRKKDSQELARKLKLFNELKKDFE